jgi:hypothetical protein
MSRLFLSEILRRNGRGQLHICSEVMSPGAWDRAFNAPGWQNRFEEPTVEVSS